MTSRTVTPAPPERAAEPEHLFQVRDLRVGFRRGDSVLSAVRGIDFSLDAGETLVLLGESGSGKSVSCLAAMGLLGDPSRVEVTGSARLRGRELLGLRQRELVDVRGRQIAMVFQDSLSALNPCLSVGFQIAEVLRKQLGLRRGPARRQAVELMQRVSIPDAAHRSTDYPHQFSGGMRQRIMIAMAIAGEPDVLIADEPTTALDVTVQAQIMELLADLQAERHMGLLLITHDLGVAADVADRICVMYAGRIVEDADVRDIYRSAAHPYTRGLLNSVPRFDRPKGSLTPIPGSPPSAERLPPGCAFHPRCRRAATVCAQRTPALLPYPLRGDTAVTAAGSDAVGEPNRWSACHFADEVMNGG